MLADLIPMRGRLRAFAERLARDRRGATLVLLAIAILPLTMAVGVSIDYARAARLQTKINAVADAAALAAVTTPMMSQTSATACATVRRMFESQVKSIPDLTINTAQAAGLTITVTDNMGSASCDTKQPSLNGSYQRTAQVTWSGTSANAFGGLLGVRTISIGGNAQSYAAVGSYIDIHLVLDTSQSMGLAATDQAAIDLWNKTKELNGRACQFGCHSRDPKEKYANEEIANTYKIPLRVNVLRDAATDMINTAISNQSGRSIYRFGLYRIGKNQGRYAIGVDEYVKLTTDLPTVRSRVASLGLSENDGAVGFGDTDLPATTDFVKTFLSNADPAKDDGTTQDKARKFVFLVTDGVTDVEGGGCTYGHCTKPIDPARCDAYKKIGVTVGVVYTTYLPTKADPTKPSSTALRDEYIKLIQPIADQIAPSLKACASPNFYFEAADGPAIHAAMQKLFVQASKQATITR